MAWRIFSRERSSGRSDVVEKVRAEATLLVAGAASSTGNGGETKGSGAGCVSRATKTGGGGGVVVSGGSSAISGGTATTGGNGCAQLRLTLGGGGAAALGRGVIVRGRTAGGGCVPGGTPSASRKRRTRSSSVKGAARCTGSLGGEGRGGCSASLEPCLVSHLKTSASPARTRKMTVSFMGQKLCHPEPAAAQRGTSPKVPTLPSHNSRADRAHVRSLAVCAARDDKAACAIHHSSFRHSTIVRAFPSKASPLCQWLRAWSCRPGRFSSARNP